MLKSLEERFEIVQNLFPFYLNFIQSLIDVKGVPEEDIVFLMVFINEEDSNDFPPDKIIFRKGTWIFHYHTVSIGGEVSCNEQDITPIPRNN